MKGTALIETVAEPGALRRVLDARRQEGARIAFVPTMGALHEGHLALVDEARRRGDFVVMSIFVNPLQFGPREDLARYPRDVPRDTELAAGRGVDLLFVPTVETMYPAGAEIRVIPGETGSRWEGAIRPGHFEGVLTVVAKLFHLVEPAVAVFGQKDIQQAVLIRRMVRDLDWRLEIVVAPTVREPDGLALSSRNVYLGPAERQSALVLSRALRRAHDLFTGGERRAAVIHKAMEAEFRSVTTLVPDYIAVVEPASMRPVEQVDGETIVAVAGRVGSTRLIDNIILGRGLA